MKLIGPYLQKQGNSIQSQTNADYAIGQKQLHLTQGVKFMGIENINSHRLSNRKYHSDFIEEKPSEWKDNSSCMGRDQNTGKIQLNSKWIKV